MFECGVKGDIQCQTYVNLLFSTLSHDQFVRVIKKWLIHTTSLVRIRTICPNPRDG